MQIPLKIISPNPNQPRKQFDQAALDELAQSIREHGVIQPIVVEMLTPEQYIIHYGERRWRAAQLAGLTEIPCVVRAPDDTGDEASYLARAMIENIQRQDLTAIEVAEGYQRLHDHGWSDKKIAASVGKSRSTIANARRLLTLPDDIRDALAAGDISERQAMAILPVFQLPELALKRSKASNHDGPTQLLNKAKQGLASTVLRDNAKWSVQRSTEKMGYPFEAHPFEGDGYQSATCDECPVRVKVGSEHRCGDGDCASRKKEAWAALSLAAAAAQSGLPVLALAQDEERWRCTEQLSTNTAQHLLTQGCGKMRLRLAHFGWVSDPPIIAGFPNIHLVCHHGQGKRCTCLKAIRAERTKNDPTTQADKAAKRRLEVDVIAPAIKVLAQGLKAADSAAFRFVLSRFVHRDIQDFEGWDLEKTLGKLSRGMIEAYLPWRAYDDIPAIREQLRNTLATAGLDLLAPDPVDYELDRIEAKLARIASFLANEAEPTQEAVQGNQTNLNALIEALDPLLESDTASHRRQAETLLKQAGDLYDLLATEEA